MITEDYVSFEVAKLLKEKGFPQEYDLYHSMVYNEEDYEDAYEVQRMVLQTRLVKAGTLSSYPVGIPEPKCYCPTLQMAMKWLREVHKILILVEYDYPVFSSDIYKMDDIDEYGSAKHIPPTFANCKNYEEAIEAGIKYCLENLI